MNLSVNSNSPSFFVRTLPFILFFLSSFTLHSLVEPSAISGSRPSEDSVVTIRLGFVGDLMCHQPLYESARVKSDSFDFDPIFNYIKEYLSEPDLMIGNLETVCAGKERAYSGYPRFNTPDAYIPALKNASFDFLVTSNNHSMDRGEYGVLRTLEKIRGNGLSSTGTFSDQRDRDSIRLEEVKGIKTAILNYTYGTNGIALPKGKGFLVNMIDTLLIAKDIGSALSLKPDLLVVMYHFGSEYKREPDSFQKRIVDFTIRSGADIIIGSHPHVIQRTERYVTNNGRTDTGFVAYSLGNFLSNQRWRYSDAGVIINLTLEKNNISGGIKITGIGAVPTWVYSGHYDGKRQYYILPATDSPDTLKYPFLTGKEQEEIRQAYEDTREILFSQGKK